MPVLLDTDVAIELLRGNPRCLARLSRTEGRLFVSSVTAAELYFGAFNSAHPSENADRVEEFLKDIQCLLPTKEVAKRFGEIKAELRRKSIQVAPFDLLIATIALENECVVATGNERHFSRVPGLRLENWIREPLA